MNKTENLLDVIKGNLYIVHVPIIMYIFFPVGSSQ